VTTSSLDAPVAHANLIEFEHSSSSDSGVEAVPLESNSNHRNIQWFQTHFKFLAVKG